MSTNDIAAKCRELRELQALIDEAQAEAEAIKDALKAAMATQRSCGPGSTKSHGKPSRLLNST